MSEKNRYIAITESGLDIALTNKVTNESGYFNEKLDIGLNSKELDSGTILYACGHERQDEFFALIDIEELERLTGPKDLVYSRIARILKAAKKPPIHLPRLWAEFHHANFIGFFAESQKQDSKRWIAEIDGINKCVRFLKLTDAKNTVNLENHEQSQVISPRDKVDIFIKEINSQAQSSTPEKETFIKKFDLSMIGSGAVTAGRTFNDWLPNLTNEQKKAVMLPVTESVRIVGPAGTGKTLTLCMRAIQIANNKEIVGGRKKILIVSHSWAMAERIDQIITTLNYGEIPESITVLPLLSVIQLHANNSMGSHYEILGDDSQEGSRRVMEIIERVIVEEDLLGDLNVSAWIKSAISSPTGSSTHSELVFDLYEEITGVISAQNIFPGDSDKISEYFSMEREDNLPPFMTRQDRTFCMRVFDELLRRLIDRGLITTDQLILDAIKIFETFSWNVKRQTEGYDYVLVDELQLFGPQERLAISLLARTRSGFFWAAAEDPSQGVFSSLYGKDGKSARLDSIYLNDVHRFNSGLFRFIQFIYGKFPLNVPALNISHEESSPSIPTIKAEIEISEIFESVKRRATEILDGLGRDARLAVVFVGEGAEEVTDKLTEMQVNPIQLRSFDDVERLSYQKKAIVVSPWQFIGGTQFSHVLLVISDTIPPQSSFARLRELTAIYLGASRASEYLEVMCTQRIPQALQDALTEGVIKKAT